MMLRLAGINNRWQEPFGDRQQELVIIGINMDKANLIAEFDRCLLTPTEMLLGDMGEYMQGWKALSDPFPVWNQHEAETEMA